MVKWNKWSDKSFDENLLVDKWKIHSHLKMFYEINSINSFVKCLPKNVVFTKFLSKKCESKFLEFAHCGCRRSRRRQPKIDVFNGMLAKKARNTPELSFLRLLKCYKIQLVRDYYFSYLEAYDIQWPKVIYSHYENWLNYF